MKPTDERPNRIPWPPIILVAAIVAGSVLNALYPLRLARGTAADIFQGVGIVTVILAIVLYVLAGREMSRRKTAILPTKGADHLVTGGPFSFSRNPIYLATVVLVIGWGLIAVNAWMFLAAIACGYAEQKLAIEREEVHLEHRFGKAWRDYRKKVRRWV